MLGGRQAFGVGLVWLSWFSAVLGTVALGLAAGAYVGKPGWVVNQGLWPLLSWDYNWYLSIARTGYPSGRGGGEYAFFPLWPLLLRWAGMHWDVVAGAALAWVSSAAAFFGLAAGIPRARLRTALALACWPGSFALLLAYPDGLAMAAGAWAAVFALRGRLVTAGLIGAVAALARPNGFLIALPLVWLAWGKGPRAWFGAALPVAAAAGVEAYFWARSGRATAFFDAQALWGVGGPRFDERSVQLVGDMLERNGLLIGLLAVVAAAAIALSWRRFGFGLWTTVVVAAAVLLLLSAVSLEMFLNSARAALVLPLLVVLWQLGPRYRPWAAFATAVIAVLLVSGQMQSFGKQSLFAFPIFWAIADGPRWLRYPPLAVLGFAANLGLTLLLTHYPP